MLDCYFRPKYISERKKTTKRPQKKDHKKKTTKEIEENMGASLVAQRVKNLPAVQETHVPSLGWKDPL